MMLALACTHTVNAADLTLYYNKRPPFVAASANGEVHGVVADPAMSILHAARISFEWQERPINRELAIIEAGQEVACAVGLFKTPDRASRAQFSLPLYRDHAMAVVANRDKLTTPTSLDELMSTRRYRLIVKEKFSYGPTIDAIIARQHPQTFSSPYDMVDLFNQVRKGLADYTIAPGEEAAYWLTHDALMQADLRLINYPDIPPGELRYLMCSNAVPPAQMRRINHAIAQMLHIE
jgi:uncharacterized protein (TIGR02285 family)